MCNIQRLSAVEAQKASTGWMLDQWDGFAQSALQAKVNNQDHHMTTP
jgi:hypothetical protein